jgi:hypothetical protein
MCGLGHLESFLPLPEGEGWGEGTVSDVNPCRGLVAQHLRRFSVWPGESITLTPDPSPGGRRENKVLVLMTGHLAYSPSLVPLGICAFAFLPR